ncbi:MAG: RNA-binding cell elongation regulator Jag/EloR [bacterium]|nr:RNA-binding cell elongation regulator Jag/EloR [bacterium]
MEQLPSVEATGDSVESAINAGLAQLGVGPGDVIVEVLDEPSRGVFGIGARPARVRLKMLRPLAPPPPPAPAVTPSPPQPEPVERQPRRDSADSRNNARPSKAGEQRPRQQRKPSTPTSEQRQAKPVASVEDFGDAYDEDMDELYLGELGEQSVVVEELDEDGTVGKKVLSELLDYMGIEYEITVRRSEPSRAGENSPWLMDVTGPSVSLLIGRRGETLAALQYITRLIASRQLQRRANIIVDVAAHKARRSQRLRQLAIRMADQAVQQERTVSLEPMPPNERRIVHLTLRNRTDVYTKSTGEGEARKVTIIPVK